MVELRMAVLRASSSSFGVKDRFIFRKYKRDGRLVWRVPESQKDIEPVFVVFVEYIWLRIPEGPAADATSTEKEKRKGHRFFE